MDETIEYRLLSDGVDRINLELQGNPDFDDLAVFIRDPANPQQYWFRQLHIPIPSDSNDITYRDLPMGAFNQIPCPVEHLGKAVNKMVRIQIELQEHPDDTGKVHQAQVGVAEYTGDGFPLYMIIPLVAEKYNRMRQEHSQRVDC